MHTIVVDPWIAGYAPGLANDYVRYYGYERALRLAQAKAWHIDTPERRANWAYIQRAITGE